MGSDDTRTTRGSLDTWIDGNAPAPDPDVSHEDRGLIGMGGMGEVRRVFDPQLQRTMAMKVIREPLAKRIDHVARFISEARATAQLEHPGIVPIYQAGALPDGRPYFTMKEVKGRELTEVLAANPPLRRSIDLLTRVCEAVGFAHGHGVIHRDLKPANVMVGDFGEVLVVDWGLAQHVDTASTLGRVVGTPAFMPPEQAAGHHDLDARADVYALGTMLFEILAGAPARQGNSSDEVLQEVLAGPPDFSRIVDRPAGLVETCRRAMSHDREDRHPDAMAFAEDLRAWAEGAKARRLALERVAAAHALAKEVAAMREEAAAHRAEAARLLEDVPDWAPEADKLAGWRAEDHATQLERDADLGDLEVERRLYDALRQAPDLVDAHETLALRHLHDHEQAELASDRSAMDRAEALLRVRLAELPEDHETAVRARTYLHWRGLCTVHTSVPAQASLWRWELADRRLRARHLADLGPTPVTDLELEMGSYQLLLTAEGRADVTYPFAIWRGRHHRELRGDGSEGTVYLPAEDEVGPDECYVPAGWTVLGGDAEAGGDRMERTEAWIDGFVIQRFPVTNRQYLVFLDDLVAQGREEDALAWAPRHQGASLGEAGDLLLGRTDDGRFALVRDREGDLWGEDWPVIMIDWHCATAYAEWLSARTGLPWRLPYEVEWEKAARGVDARFHPWGDLFDPSWACGRYGFEGRGLPEDVNGHPVDCSPYGVRGLGGNVRDWCADVYNMDGPGAQGATYAFGGPQQRRPIRGGHWAGTRASVRCAYRYGLEIGYRSSHVGFRLARSIAG